jgi:hypothetical protein
MSEASNQITGPAELLRRDTAGRVQTSRERRDALLDEFARSGLSAAGFARHYGLKYATFANWANQRRKARAAQIESGGKGSPLALAEVVVADALPASRGAEASGGLLLELPGKARMLVTGPEQVELAAELIGALARKRLPC